MSLSLWCLVVFAAGALASTEESPNYKDLVDFPFCYVKQLEVPVADLTCCLNWCDRRVSCQAVSFNRETRICQLINFLSDHTSTSTRAEYAGNILVKDKYYDQTRCSCCPDGWICSGEDGKVICMKLTSESEKYDFKDAIEYCKTLDSHLVELRTLESSQRLRLLLKEYASEPRYLIGARYDIEKGNWTWVTGGEVPSYDVWKNGKKDKESSQRPCVTLTNLEQGFFWDDALCNKAFPVICEKSL